jgi:hypothetical protein
MKFSRRAVSVFIRYDDARSALRSGLRLGQAPNVAQRGQQSYGNFAAEPVVRSAHFKRVGDKHAYAR